MLSPLLQLLFGSLAFKLTPQPSLDLPCGGYGLILNLLLLQTEYAADLGETKGKTGCAKYSSSVRIIYCASQVQLQQVGGVVDTNKRVTDQKIRLGLRQARGGYCDVDCRFSLIPGVLWSQRHFGRMTNNVLLLLVPDIAVSGICYNVTVNVPNALTRLRELAGVLVYVFCLCLLVVVQVRSHAGTYPLRMSSVPCPVT